MKGKQTYEVELQSEIFKSFRTQLAANSLDIDVEKKSKHYLKVECDFPNDWKIGVIYGASGSGKTTLAKKIFGDKIFDVKINENLTVIDQLPKELKYEECAKALAGIGLTAVNCWIRPIKTLSNGQKARAEACLLMYNNDNSITVIDEWTSVVDRTVAKVMSHCIKKFSNKQTKQIILLTCHHDIIEWVNPDWLIDCNKQQFFLPKSETFFFQKREQIKFTIREIGRDTWKYFSKYHYLSDKLPGGASYLYGLFYGEDQIGFQAWTNYVPRAKGKAIQYHSNRTVIHPDYAGFGIGIRLINETAKLMMKKLPDCQLMAKFSSMPIYKLMLREPCWKYEGAKTLFGKMKSNLKRNGGFRENGIKTYHFRYKNVATL